jgi:hypothetical protein
LTTGNSNDTLLVREVFDFNVGDEFHYLEDASHYLPGGFYKKIDRIIIADKFYSENSDTVYYRRSINGYTENLVPTPPGSEYPFEWKYYFHSYEDQVSYTDLDSSILSLILKDHFNFLNEIEWNEWFLSDTLIYQSEEFCNYQINGYRLSYFDEDLVECGKGLGIVQISKSREECMCDVKNLKLIYFNKGTDSCGVADNRTNTGNISLTVNSSFHIYPNPVVNYPDIESPDELTGGIISVYDISGNILLCTKINSSKCSIDLSELSSGLYFIKIIDAISIKSFRIIKL